jgi:hypothetical protein
MELPMQDNTSGPDQRERRIIRTWRIGVVAFYGSIMAIMILLANVGERATRVAANRHSPSIQETIAPR